MSITWWIIFFGVITFVGSVIIAPGIHAYVAYYLAPGRLLNKILFDEKYRGALVDSLVMGLLQERTAQHDGHQYKAIDLLVNRALEILSKGLPGVASITRQIKDELGQELSPGQAIVVSLLPKNLQKSALSYMTKNQGKGQKPQETGGKSPFGE